MATDGNPLLLEIQQTKPFSSPVEAAAVGLVLTTDLLRRRVAAQIEPRGITHQQYNVLRILRGSHPDALPTLEIAERMIDKSPGITRLLDRLAVKGLVDRKRCDRDRRSVRCSITPAGFDLLETLDPLVLAEVEAAFRPLGAQGSLELTRLLDALRAGIHALPVT